MWLLSRSDYGDYRLTEFYDEDDVPPYAILSHRCLQPDAAEPTFQDLWRGLGQEKPGYKKIEFCGEQAERDGLEYFWVDTCCINKENHSEHQHALRSMFHWYRRSEKCYVYLNDVCGSNTSIIPRSWFWAIEHNWIFGDQGKTAQTEVPDPFTFSHVKRSLCFPL